MVQKKLMLFCIVSKCNRKRRPFTQNLQLYKRAQYSLGSSQTAVAQGRIVSNGSLQRQVFQVQAR